MYRTPQPSPKLPPSRRGIIWGNPSIRYGLVVIMGCMLIVNLYQRSIRARLSGPINDIFVRRAHELIIVYGTGGGDGPILRDYVHSASVLLGKRLAAEIPVYPDVEVTDDLLEDYSVILYGPVQNNLVAGKMTGSFPFDFFPGGVALGGTRVENVPWRMVFIILNPFNLRQYALVYTGRTAEDVVGINLVESPNFLAYNDSTDYVLGEGKRIVQSGIFGDKSGPRWKLSVLNDSPAPPATR